MRIRIGGISSATVLFRRMAPRLMISPHNDHDLSKLLLLHQIWNFLTLRTSICGVGVATTQTFSVSQHTSRGT
jgi:hypothetical protein